MPRFVLLLAAPVLVLGLFAAGLGLGWNVRRRAEQARVPVRPPRPAAVDAALRAWADDDRPALAAALAKARDLPADAAPEMRAEIRFLEAVVRGSRRLLGELAAEEGTRPAGARAQWVLIERTRNPDTRDAMRAAFARAHPRAWVLAGEGRSGGS